MAQRHRERHHTRRSGWLRAAVLGANDGIVSTASLIVGVAASGAGRHAIITAGIAGLVAGAMSMAAGEYVSVSSQKDAEHADIERERRELATDAEAERRELAAIYVKRGLEPALAIEVADQMTAHDALAAHTRDELGISDELRARPVQAAFASAAAFGIGASMPLIVVLVSAQSVLPYAVALTSLMFLACSGAIAGRVGGASPARAAARVTFWGALALMVTAGVGALFNTAAV